MNRIHELTLTHGFFHAYMPQIKAHILVVRLSCRGMHVAFAMTGNRVEKTLRKAGLRKFIGDQWFFPTVEVPVANGQ